MAITFPKLTLGGILLIFFGISFLAQSQSQSASRYYYAIENLDTGAVVRRGTATSAGIPPFSLILAPETNYREWLYAVESGLIGTVDFRSPTAGQNLQIPPVPLGLPGLPDSDNDGLSDDAEFAIGTNPNNPDTDGDGIKDGPAVKLGIDAGASRTGIVGSTDTPGTAVDVCAVNNIVVVADSANGVAIFNVFNRMPPLIIAQVDTPGDARAVASAGNYVVVADGAAGVTILDISNPPDVPILFQGGINGTAQAVAVSGDLAFIGTVEGDLIMMELSSLTPLQSLNLGGRVEDLAIEGDTLYAYANDRLQIIPIGQGALAVGGSISSPAPNGVNTANGRGRIFVGGGNAYLVHTRGYNVFSVTNSAAPVLLLQNTTAQFGWKQVALNGSGLLLATVSPNQAFDGAHNLWRLALTNSAVAATFETEFVTPGVARSLAIYNGMAYVADNTSGLEVIRYKETDFLGQRPGGVLSVNVTNGTNGIVVEGTRVFFRAAVTDDVQVRNVEFYVDGVRAATDGNYPFEFGWRAPAGEVGRTFKFTAIASDTGGNQTNLNTLQLRITPDTHPPTVTVNSPTLNQIYFVGDDIIVRVGAFDNVGIGSLVFMLDGLVVPAKRVSLTDWLLLAPLTPGAHQVTVKAVDNSGAETVSAPFNINARQQAISREISTFNWYTLPAGKEAISREVSTFNWFTLPEGKEAISREVSTFNWFSQPEGKEAISRELSTFNWFTLPAGKEAISREISVQRQ
jgi:hypothetical protein